MNKFLTLLFVWFIGCLVAVAQTPAQFDNVLSEQFKTNESGCTVLVTRKGHVIYQKAFGMANLELNVPMQPDNIFSYRFHYQAIYSHCHSATHGTG